MAKKEPDLWELVVETVTIVAALVFLGLQIYYGYVYLQSKKHKRCNNRDS